MASPGRVKKDSSLEIIFTLLQTAVGNAELDGPMVSLVISQLCRRKVFKLDFLLAIS